MAVMDPTEDPKDGVCMVCGDAVIIEPAFGLVFHVDESLDDDHEAQIQTWV